LPHKLPHAAQQTWASPEIIFDHSEVALNGNAIVRTRPIFWEWQGTQREPDYWPRLAVREGDWKLATTIEGKLTREEFVISTERQQRGGRCLPLAWQTTC